MTKESDMSRDLHTSDRTSLGLVLQYLVEDALSELGVKYKGNVSYYSNFIKPDVFIPGDTPRYSVHVTATGADDSFQMKRWRYIDEVMQMRSVFGAKFVSINLMFGPFDHYRESDKAVIGNLFDYSLFVDRLPAGREAFDLCNNAVTSAGAGKKSREIATELMSNRTVARVMSKVGKDLNDLIGSDVKSRISKDVANKLMNFHKTREKYLLENPPKMGGQAFWKRTLLRFLSISPEYWQTTFSLGIGEVAVDKLSPSFVKQALDADLIRVRDGVGGARFASLAKEVALTIKAGLSLEMVKGVGEIAQSDPRRKFELQDLWDDGVRAKQAIGEFLSTLRQGEASLIKLLAYSIENGGSPLQRHHRAHTIDIALSALGLSQNRLQSLYKGPNFGVKNLIQNVVPRTLLCTEAVLKKKINPTEISSEIVAAIRPFCKEILSALTNDLESRYIAARRYNLTKGSSIDPLEDYVSALLVKNGWDMKAPGITCSHELVGRVKTVFSFVAVKGNKVIVLKSLFGDTGADHKAEEMEARMRMVRLSLEDDKSRELITVFVADGKWNNGNVNSLILGGWDFVVTVSDFPRLLENLS